MKFFDSNIYIGQPTVPKGKSIKTAEELIKEMDKHNIEKSLVWHIAQRDVFPELGNTLLSEAIYGKERLLGCWTILPPQTEEGIGKDFFEQMKKNRIYALRLFPDKHNFVVNKITFGDFFTEVIERRIPVFLSGDMLAAQKGEFTYKILQDFPDLICILCDIGIWSVNRYTWPLLEKFPRIYIETSWLALEDGGIEETVKKFGSSRLVFGTGFPERYPESSILSLLYAEISDEDKEKIAYKNMEKIISNINL